MSDDGDLRVLRLVFGSRELGLALDRFHRGQGDPVYAVSSSFYVGQPIKLETAEIAETLLESELHALFEIDPAEGEVLQEALESLREAIRRVTD